MTFGTDQYPRVSATAAEATTAIDDAIRTTPSLITTDECT
jgi:hypothetical protein